MVSRKLAVVAALALLVVPRALAAQTQPPMNPAPPPQQPAPPQQPQPRLVDATDAVLDVRVNANMTADLVLAPTQSAASVAQYDTCYARRGYDRYDPYGTYESLVDFQPGPHERLGPSTKLSRDVYEGSTLDWLVWNAMGDRAQHLLVCYKAGSTATVYHIPLGHVRLPAELTSSDPVVAPDLEWIGLDGFRGARLHEALGAATSCKYKPDTGGKSLICTPIDEPSGVRLSFTDDTKSSVSPTSGQVKITFARASVSARLDACVFNIDGPMPMLVQGARRQRLVFSARPAACASRFFSGTSFEPRERAVLVVDGQSVGGRVAPASSGSIAFDLESIPDKIALGWQDAQLKDSSDRVRGRARVQVAPGFSLANDKTLRVSYTEAWFDVRQAGLSEKGIAVVDPCAAIKTAPCDKWQITNVATLNGPPGLPVASRREAPAVARTPTSAKVVDYIWSVAPPGKDDIVDVMGTGATTEPSAGCLPSAAPPDGPGSAALPAACFVPDPSEVRFRANGKTTGPITIRLSLHAVVLGLPVPPDPKAAAGAPGVPGLPSAGGEQELPRVLAEEPLLVYDVAVADSARPEAIPYPIGLPGAMDVTCDLGGTVVIQNSERRGIDEDALRIGRCSAALHPEILGKATTKKIKELSMLFGNQTILVSVRRDGATEEKRLWIVEPNERTTFPLPRPSSDEHGSGAYSVEIRVAAEPSEVTVYRPGNAPKSAADVTNVHPELRYSSLLNPRGPFATGKSVRTFLTVPVDLSGVRFPANARDLRTSDQATLYQYIPPTVGLLFVLEPWDYDASRNSLVGLRFNAGAHVFKLSGDSPALSTVVGASWSLPLFDAPAQLGTTANINVYYEKDWRSPLGEGHYLVVTTGVNILSLLAGK